MGCQPSGGKCSKAKKIPVGPRGCTDLQKPQKKTLVYFNQRCGIITKARTGRNHIIKAKWM